MKKYIWIIVLLVVMFASFLISGLFFLNSGLIDSQTNSIDNRQSIEILKELNKLPLVQINVYEIDFYKKGILEKIGNGELVINLNGDKKVFLYDGNSSINEGEFVIFYYNFLPDDKQKIIWIQKKQ